MSCIASPAGWDRIPRAGTESWCCTSPSETEWSTAWPRSRWSRPWTPPPRTPRAQIWSTGPPAGTGWPSCPVRGQTAPPGASSSPSAAPASRLYHLQPHQHTHTGIHLKLFTHLFTSILVFNHFTGIWFSPYYRSFGFFFFFFYKSKEYD